MAITIADLKFRQSERMTDNTDGGGRMSGTEIVSGADNQIFDDVSDVDRAAGDVSIRKIYAAVTSADTDKYLDAGVVVFAEPADPAASVLVFTTASYYDERAALRNYIESFLIKGPLWPCYLYGNHIAGQRSISLLNNPNAALPALNQTLVLAENENQQSYKEQYVRVIRIEAETRTFVDDAGEFTRVVVNCELSDALRYAFTGYEPRRETNFSRTSVVRDTLIAAAANYYGIHPVTAQAALGATVVQCSSAYSQLIPALTADTPVVDVLAGSDLTVAADGGGRQTTIGQIAHTDWIPVTAETQQMAYTNALLPKPLAGTVRASYRAEGAWYTLEDQGDGTLTGPGVGTINYLTGSASITLNAIPDVNSAILWSWGSGAHVTSPVLDSVQDTLLPGWVGQLAQPPAPNTVTFEWLEDGASRSASDQDGEIKGDGTGTLIYADGRFTLKPATLPDPTTDLRVLYQIRESVTEEFTPALDGNRFIRLEVAEPPVRPNSVRVRWTCQVTKNQLLGTV